VDALALALDGTRTVAAYSLSGEMTSLISISYLAAGLGCDVLWLRWIRVNTPQSSVLTLYMHGALGWGPDESSEKISVACSKPTDLHQCQECSATIAEVGRSSIVRHQP
jgi:hypothetical protein